MLMPCLGYCHGGLNSSGRGGAGPCGERRAFLAKALCSGFYDAFNMRDSYHGSFASMPVVLPLGSNYRSLIRAKGRAGVWRVNYVVIFWWTFAGIELKDIKAIWSSSDGICLVCGHTLFCYLYSWIVWK